MVMSPAGPELRMTALVKTSSNFKLVNVTHPLVRKDVK
jgi:hypothetical protein